LAAWTAAAHTDGFAAVESWAEQTLTAKATEQASVAIAGGTRLTRLENGIRVVTDEIRGVSQVAIGVVVECGSRHEAADERGLAHLCEHMLFQGTSLRDSMQIARHIDYAGGRVGGFTTRDYTCFHASVLGDYCYHALDLLGDMLLNFTLPQESVEREKQSILSEIREQQDIPPHYLDAQVKREAWAGHSLAWPVTGTEESVRGFTREDIIYFLHRNYTPDRIIVAAAGDLNHDDFVAQVHDAFWRFLGEGCNQEDGAAGFEPGFAMVELPCAQSYFHVGFPAPAYEAENRYAMHVLSWILGGGLSSRLFRRLREEKGWVYQVDTDYQAYRGAGMLSLEGSTTPELLLDVIPVALQCISDVAGWKAPVTAEELDRAKTAIRAQFLIASEDVHTRMCRAATQQLYFGRTIPVEEIAAGIGAVSLPEMKSLARWMGHEAVPRANVAVGGPLPGEKDFALLRDTVNRRLKRSGLTRTERAA
ncbi:MAG: insulinase family protein, partial [Bryobacterales bacterium]|nr:insulinase family protein [Bryobacterales bacterium]